MKATTEEESMEVLKDWGEGEAFPANKHAYQKAAKHNDAEVPVHLWNERASSGSRVTLQDRELDCLRNCLLWYWKCLVTKSFYLECQKWRHTAHAGGVPVNKGAVCKRATALVLAAKVTWWEWPRGSVPFF